MTGRGYEIEWFPEISGFGKRITDSGAESYILRYRFDDPDDLKRKSNQYTFTIGKAQTSRRGDGWTFGAARDEAKAWRRKIDRGVDHPLAHRRGRREAAKAVREAETYKEAVEDYVTRFQKGERGNATADETRRVLLQEGERASWSDMPVASIRPRDIQKVLEMIRDGDERKGIAPRPYLANRAFAYLRTFFAWCARPAVEKVQASPMLGLSRPWHGEESRTRTFSDREIKRLWKAADALAVVPGAFLKVLILTGKRKTALAGMKWSEIGDDSVWTPPQPNRRRRGNKRNHPTPLPALAQRIITALKPADDKTASEYVFAGRRHGTHLHPGAILQKDIQEKSGITDFFYHATRHTLETRLAEMRIPPHVRDLVLDHAPARGAGAGYDHWDYRDEIAEAFEAWAAHVEKVVRPAGVRVLR